MFDEFLDDVTMSNVQLGNIGFDLLGGMKKVGGLMERGIGVILVAGTIIILYPRTKRSLEKIKNYREISAAKKVAGQVAIAKKVK